jgi:hypothetical protein
MKSTKRINGSIGASVHDPSNTAARSTIVAPRTAERFNKS